jgi:hypothetical protein
VENSEDVFHDVERLPVTKLGSRGTATAAIGEPHGSFHGHQSRHEERHAYKGRWKALRMQTECCPIVVNAVAVKD